MFDAWVLLTVFVAIFLFYLNRITQRYATKQFSSGSSSIALIISHPDDEVMFFSPTILDILRRGQNIFVISLTNGNFDGLGNRREKELLKSCKELGINTECVSVLNDSRFLDGPAEQWNIPDLTLVLEHYLGERDIDMVISFGENGVSGHQNHKDTYNAVKQLTDYKRFFLQDVNIFRKYSSIFDVFFTCIVENSNKRQVIAISSTKNIYKSYLAMKCHESQFVWFRRLYFLFSRYVIINNFIVMEKGE